MIVRVSLGGQMSKKISFREICQLSTQALLVQIEHHSHIKKGKDHDQEWARVFPLLEIYLHNKLLLKLLEPQTVSVFPWTSWKFDGIQYPR